ncbi:MAG: DNA-3-methyladenine glycosylase I [Verrucomicrobia bacterium]|nr:DNA-3-methyladenine glycosylase I [Verrucomicrobiota bacterium]
MNANLPRCPWPTDDQYRAYHDHEWGVPQHDDRHLFEMLLLEGAQAGLSWITILRKRENYRTAFGHFEAGRVARYDSRNVQQLLANPGIVRNRLKIMAAIQNAKAFLSVIEECGSFDKYIWQFVGGRSKQNCWRTMQEVPARTSESDAMSNDLTKCGFKFVGSTICYAFMQAVGMVNDHLVVCYRHGEVARLK